jgi:hypothetical protein
MTFAKVDTPRLDGGYDNTKVVRCVECKRDFAPLQPSHETAGVENGLRILLQLALDEMQNVFEAVAENHDNKRWPVKYGTPYGAINGMSKVRENILSQAAMWGIALSPHRKPAAALPARPAPDAVREEVARVIAPPVPFSLCCPFCGERDRCNCERDRQAAALAKADAILALLNPQGECPLRTALNTAIAKGLYPTVGLTRPADQHFSPPDPERAWTAEVYGREGTWTGEGPTAEGALREAMGGKS